MRGTQKRIINVSNRLPLKINTCEGRISYQKSEGGLATGLGSVFSQYENIWIGWPGAEVHQSEQDKVTEELEGHNLCPVFLTKEEISDFYEGFSNEIIWPLFHYFTTYSVYSPQYWDAYCTVNRKFADEILKHATKDDIIWIQDYHLMLLPQMLREANPELTIGYFQHIPFPAFEIFKALPWKEQVIIGLLGADIVGFQTDNDARHFSSVAAKLTGYERYDNDFVINDRRVSVGAFPISIDYNKYKELAEHDTTRKICQKIKKLTNTKIVISIDRLDYSKGIIQRLQAYDMFLKRYSEWRNKVTYIHLVVPSRENVCSYKTLKEEMNRLISDINGKYATIGWQPIQHLYRSLPPNLLSALYRSADLALVTPLIDGMNLVCKEYIASNSSGALILGESAGAASELGNAFLINPNDVATFAATINSALSSPYEERQVAMQAMQHKVATADIFHWAKSFLSKLTDLKKKQQQLPLKVNEGVRTKIEDLYESSNSRLILLDYDGTVVPFFKRPEDAYPNSALLQVLKDLSSDKRNDVVIISGRDRKTLDKWLGYLNVKIVAEHGAWFKDKGKEWVAPVNLGTEWKDLVNRTLTSYSQESPGTFLEEKAYSIAWHYRAAEPGLNDEYIRSIVKKLRGTIGRELDILQGNKVIEVKNQRINKGTAVTSLISKKKYDFVMAIGDDRTDEDMFCALPEDTITIKVGYDSSAATYYQPSYKEVNLLLKSITERFKNSVTMSLS